MSVRSSLLAILSEGPAYGYQLRGDFDLRTGGTWPLNVGQVYSTLERLERDGLVDRSGSDDEGRVRYTLTAGGSAEVRSWLTTPVQRQATRDELAMKLAIAATLPSVVISDIIQIQRSSTLAHLQSLTRTKADAAAPSSTADLAWSLVVESMLFQAEAEVRWLDHTEAVIAKAVRQGLVGAPASTAADTTATRVPR
ncbi:PadR family transcriptional regulator [uncultured Amnibacterium sp.]|uniref:PadR family transcriptional regulator n=1 Tax=uncultured Amnibacterium sp. TaxID=1631851 RepID=UPI0035CC8BC1